MVVRVTSGYARCLSDDAAGCATTARASALVVGGNLGLFAGDGLSDGEEGVHCSQVKKIVVSSFLVVMKTSKESERRCRSDLYRCPSTTFYTMAMV